jgi:hypothetical protein
MRLRPFAALAVLAAVAGLTATATPADAHRKPAPACGCHPHHRATRVARHGRVRRAHNVEVAVQRDVHIAPSGLREEHSSEWSEERAWSDGDARFAGRPAYGWGGRPSATDQFGYLTWPGKTHFADGQPVDTGLPPPPPPAVVVPAPTRRPAAWQGPPPATDDGRGLSRF